MLGGFEGHSGHHQIRMKSNQRKELRDEEITLCARLNFLVAHKNKFPFLFRSVRCGLQSLAPCVSSS